jgi:hypothetical protein
MPTFPLSPLRPAHDHARGQPRFTMKYYLKPNCSKEVVREVNPIACRHPLSPREASKMSNIRR